MRSLLFDVDADQFTASLGAALAEPASEVKPSFPPVVRVVPRPPSCNDAILALLERTGRRLPTTTIIAMLSPTFSRACVKSSLERLRRCEVVGTIPRQAATTYGWGHGLVAWKNIEVAKPPRPRRRQGRHHRCDDCAGETAMCNTCRAIAKATAARMADEALWGPDPVWDIPIAPEATSAQPGSEEKIRVLRERYKAGYSLFHPDDVTARPMALPWLGQ